MSTGEAFDPDYVPADPIVAALDLFARMPVIIGQAPELGRRTAVRRHRRNDGPGRCAGRARLERRPGCRCRDGLRPHGTRRDFVMASAPWCSVL
jgi:hypothetical protein